MSLNFLQQVKEATDKIICNAADLKIIDPKVLAGKDSQPVAGIETFWYIQVVCSYFFYLNPLQNDTIMTSQCIHFIFCRGES